MSNVTPIRRPAKKKRTVAEIKADFDYHLRQAKENGWTVPCEGKSMIFTDYFRSPSEREAAKMCEGCPMKADANLCLEYGNAIRAGVGVWGGVAFRLGKPMTVEGYVEESEESDEIEELVA